MRFSKKLSHLKAAIALHFAYYNFCRVHSTLRVTPAMEAGLTDHVWSIAELLGAGAKLPRHLRQSIERGTTICAVWMGSGSNKN